MPDDVYASPDAAKKYVDTAFASLTDDEKRSFGFQGYRPTPPAAPKGKKPKKAQVEPTRESILSLHKARSAALSKV